MTAGSIELFPIRVAPMGAPPHPSASIPVNPSLMSKQRVCRNLFGRVEAGSTEAELRNEEQIKLEEWKKRFDIDLRSNLRFALPVQQQQQQQQQQTDEKAAEERLVKLPNLIEQELQEHKERLALKQQNENLDKPHEHKDIIDDVNDKVKKNEKCNLTAEQLRENAETTPQSQRMINATSNNSNTNNSKHLSTSGSKQRNHCNDGTGSQSQIRSQPYARQKLISECFTTRRKPILHQSISERSKHWPGLWPESAATATLLLNTPSSPSSTATATATTTESVCISSSSSSNNSSSIKQT